MTGQSSARPCCWTFCAPSKVILGGIFEENPFYVPPNENPEGIR
jgi:hypothetical protein